MPSYASHGALVLFAVVLYFLNYEANTLPPEPVLKLGTPGYDIEPAQAPVGTGLKLQFLSWLLTRTGFIGRAIRRTLLNDNKVHLLPQLASQVPPTTLPITRPAMRLSTTEHKAHLDASSTAGVTPTMETAIKRVQTHRSRTQRATRLKSPTPSQPNATHYGVEDYHLAYLDGVRPSTLVTRLLSAIPTLEARLGRIFVEVQPEAVLAAARASDARWAAGQPLGIWDGVPVAVKASPTPLPART